MSLHDPDPLCIDGPQSTCRCNKCVNRRRTAAEAACAASPAKPAEACFQCDGDGDAPGGGNCPRCGGSGKERPAATAAGAEQPLPARSNRPAVQDMVVADVRERKALGLRRYDGTVLQAFNGRNAIVDAYQEGLDLVMYLRQTLAETDEVLDALKSLIESCEEDGMQVGQYREVLDAALASRSSGKA